MDLGYLTRAPYSLTVAQTLHRVAIVRVDARSTTKPIVLIFPDKVDVERAYLALEALATETEKADMVKIGSEGTRKHLARLAQAIMTLPRLSRIRDLLRAHYHPDY